MRVYLERAASLALVITYAAVIVWGIWQIADVAIGRNTHKHDNCQRLRVEFFERCAAYEPRHSCEAKWAQLGGKVFDANPVLSIADQIDCSEEFE